MSQERRAVLAVALCVLTLLGWQVASNYFQKKYPPPPPVTATTPPPPATPPASSPAASAAQAGVTGVTGAPAAAPDGSAPAAAAPAGPPPEQRILIERPGLYRAEITTYGAALTSFELLNPKYFTKDMRRLVVRPGSDTPTVERRSTDGPTNLLASHKPALWTSLTSREVAVPSQQPYALVSDETLPDQSRKLVLASDNSGVVVRKTLVFAARAFQINETVEVQNNRKQPVSYHFELGLTGFQDPSQKPGGAFSARVPQNEVLWDVSGKMRNLNLEALRDGKADADKLRGQLRWIGIGQQYFLFAAAMPSGAQLGDKQGHASADANGALAISAEYAEQSLQPGESASYPIAVYGGPKLPELLDDVTVGGQAAGLQTSIDYTLAVLARPLLWLLRQIYQITNNWAVAIILLTLLIKLVMLYPSQKSMQSMKAMAKLKPEMDALQLKYKDDKARLNEEMMGLYRKHGVNPLGGCLPILLQMPIYFALYSMLGNAVELYRVRLFWIPDLTAADPYYVLPLATGAVMLLQAKVTPTSNDPQQKTMALMMPIMFTGFSIFLPAGLTLYIMTNTLLGMIQQAWVTRSGNSTPAVAPVGQSLTKK